MRERRPLTPGKIRGLTATSNEAGIFTILAADHRDALRAILAPQAPDRVPSHRLTEAKLELLRALGADATAVMLDPEYSAAQAICARALPGTLGFLAAVEAQGYLGDPAAHHTTLLDGWSVEKAKRLGANGVKLLVLYRPDVEEIAQRQDEVIAAVVAECARHDIPLFLEPVAYPIADERSDAAAFARRRRAVVVGSVRRLCRLQPDVLKLPFPVDVRHEPDRGVWRDACAEVDDAADVPWALLSGGDPYELFAEQVDTACRAGAAGFMVGRALWGDAVTAAPERRRRLRTDVARPRLRDLAERATRVGRAWTDSHDWPEVDEHWYLTY